ALLRGRPQRLAQPFDLAPAEPALARCAGEPAHTLRGIGFDLPEANRMLTSGMQRRHGPRGHALAAGGGAAAAARARLRGLAGRNVRLRTFDIAKLEGCDLAATEERLDVRLDAAAVHRQRGRLDRPPTAAEDPPGFRLGQIP